MEALTTWKVTESTSMLKLKGAHGPDEETAQERANRRRTSGKGFLTFRVTGPESWVLVCTLKRQRLEALVFMLFLTPEFLCLFICESH